MVRCSIVGIISVHIASVVVVVVVVACIMSHTHCCFWWSGYGGAVNVAPPSPLHVSHHVVISIVIALIASHHCHCHCLWWWHNQVRGWHEDRCMSCCIVVASGDSMTR